MTFLSKLLSSCALVAAFLWSAQPAHAELNATAVAGESRLVEFPYDESKLYLVLTRPRRDTFVEFGPDERIRWLSVGDSASFKVTLAKSNEFLTIKPRNENDETNLNVRTTKRHYSIILKSTSEEGKWYAKVNWTYPDATLADLTSEAKAEDQRAEAVELRAEAQKVRGEQPSTLLSAAEIDSMNFEYEITGNASFRPAFVTDNGTFTWIKLPRRLQELPALFKAQKDDPTHMALIPYEVKGDLIEVQGVADRLILKLGKDEAQIDRKPYDVARRRSSFFH